MNDMFITISVVFSMTSAPILATVLSNRKHRRQWGLQRYRVSEEDMNMFLEKCPLEVVLLNKKRIE